MPATKELKFTCSKCSKEYRWKPELAGKQAKCKCGATISIPSTPPPPPPEPEPEDDLDGLYSLAAEEQKATAAPQQGYRCPSCGAGLPVGAAICTNCGVDLRTGKKASTTVKGAGFAGAAAAPRGSPATGKRTALATAVATTGKVIDTVNLVRIWTRRIGAGLVVLILIALMIFRVYRKIVRPIAAMSGTTAAEERQDLDAAAVESLNMDGATEARAWLAANAGGTVINLGKGKTKPTIDQLYQMGAKKVTVSGFADKDREIATILVIELPPDRAARKKLLDWENKTQKKLAEGGDDDLDPTEDVGQKYLEVYFGSP
jgi:hypothetical protein